jgi:hypothetical protein
VTTRQFGVFIGVILLDSNKKQARPAGLSGDLACLPRSIHPGISVFAVFDLFSGIGVENKRKIKFHKFATIFWRDTKRRRRE